MKELAAGGRYLSDVWQLNLETLTWTNVTTAYSQEANGSTTDEIPDDTVANVFPACAAAVALSHRGRALLIGGHTKAQKNNPSAPLIVRVLDPARQTWGALPCSGAVPAARGSHVAAIIGDKVLSASHCIPFSILHLVGPAWQAASHAEMLVCFLAHVPGHVLDEYLRMKLQFHVHTTWHS